jgi:hypothetical protein
MLPSGISPGRILANVCGRLKMNKFHPYAEFFNWPYCARPNKFIFNVAANSVGQRHDFLF